MTGVFEESLKKVRLDVWLDVSCLFRTRSEAQKACKGGKIDVNGQKAKPQRNIRPEDVISITRVNSIKQQIVVKQLAERHLPKAEARTLYNDTTPPLSREEKVFRQMLRRIGPTATAPDKRQRRQLRLLKGR